MKIIVVLFALVAYVSAYAIWSGGNGLGGVGLGGARLAVPVGGYGIGGYGPRVYSLGGRGIGGYNVGGLGLRRVIISTPIYGGGLGQRHLGGLYGGVWKK